MRSARTRRREVRRIELAIAARLRRRRAELGLTEHQVAEVLGMTVTQFGKYESGETRIPASWLCLAARQLLVRTDWFFDGL